MFGQVDAIGQIAGGPGVGLIANWISVGAAITTSGLLLTPALFLIGRANRQSLAEDDASAITFEPEGSD
jgi:DHA3 family tetracycline resistance protein-like MFS transporter